MAKAKSQLFRARIIYSQVRDFFMVKLFVYSDFGPATYCSSSLHPLQAAKRSLMSNTALHAPTHTCTIFNYIPTSSLSRFSCLSFAYARGLVTEDFATILALRLDRLKFHRKLNAEDAETSCQAVKTAKMFEALAAKFSLLSKSCTS